MAKTTKITVVRFSGLTDEEWADYIRHAYEPGSVYPDGTPVPGWSYQRFVELCDKFNQCFEAFVSAGGNDTTMALLPSVQVNYTPLR